MVRESLNTLSRPWFESNRTLQSSRFFGIAFLANQLSRKLRIMLVDILCSRAEYATRIMRRMMRFLLLRLC